MHLSVVIVNWNGAELLRACLKSMMPFPEHVEVIVVDNGSTDESLHMLQSEFHQVEVERLRDNRGFAEGCNQGIRASTAEWVCTLNNDTVVEPGWWDAVIAATTTAPPECGMLQCQLRFLERDVINSTGIELERIGSGRDRGEGDSPADHSEHVEIFCPTAGAAVYRRSMLEAIVLREGYFDRRHFMYFEDMDLGWRARLAGWSARYVPDAVVKHHYQASTVRHGKAWLARIAAQNRIRTLIKNGSWQMLRRSFKNASREAWRDGRRGLPQVVLSSFWTRLQVERMRRRKRSDVEDRWMVA